MQAETTLWGNHPKDKVILSLSLPSARNTRGCHQPQSASLCPPGAHFWFGLSIEAEKAAVRILSLKQELQGSGVRPPRSQQTL